MKITLALNAKKNIIFHKYLINNVLKIVKALKLVL